MNAFRFVWSAPLLMLAIHFVSAARADEGRTMDLLMLKDDFEKRAMLMGPASAVPSQDPAAPGLVFATQPGKGDKGIHLKPAGGAKAWDLSAFGHVEALVVNTGSKAARFAVRVDNEGDWHKGPWNTEHIDLEPGERGTVTVIFGYHFNHQRGYPLDPKRVVNILLLAGQDDAPTSFRIESLLAGGPAGEKPYVPPPRILIKRQGGAPPGSDVKVDPKTWKLVWADEFDYTGPPEPTKWGYEEGYVRNKEPQYYTRARKENAWVEGGVLTLTARKEKFPIPPPGRNYDGGTDAEYTSASLITSGKASWTYGRFEIRAKLPKGHGAWPAFWTVGTTGPWPAAGEIDIMEYWASQPNTVTTNIHFALRGKHTGDGGAVDVEDPWNDFHVYAMDWNSERMEFFCDGVKYYAFDLSKADENGNNPFRKPHSLLLNLALVGGKGAIDDGSLPQKFVVDYVRLYQRVEAEKQSEGGRVESKESR